MIQQFRDNFVQVMRPHVVGDYYDGVYIRKWIDIVKRSPRVTFFTYTRTWAVQEYFDAIVELGRLPNMQLWFSFDRDMEVPPRIKGFKRCYLSVSDDDQPACKVDLIFRDDRRTVMKRGKYRALVCPYDNGVTKTTCSKCGVCWRNIYDRDTYQIDTRKASRKAAAAGV